MCMKLPDERGDKSSEMVKLSSLDNLDARGS